MDRRCLVLLTATDLEKVELDFVNDFKIIFLIQTVLKTILFSLL